MHDGITLQEEWVWKLKNLLFTLPAKSPESSGLTLVLESGTTAKIIFQDLTKPFALFCVQIDIFSVSKLPVIIVLNIVLS